NAVKKKGASHRPLIDVDDLNVRRSFHLKNIAEPFHNNPLIKQRPERPQDVKNYPFTQINFPVGCNILTINFLPKIDLYQIIQKDFQQSIEYEYFIHHSFMGYADTEDGKS
ncbi:MAG: hypothetical protein J6332_07290, partial [Abditibacteriota bacterium]|nr:hypothetical protein [Abditibacteriota bacterium]